MPQLAVHQGMESTLSGDYFESLPMEGHRHL